jgi:hypothetical protein
MENPTYKENLSNEYSQMETKDRVEAFTKELVELMKKYNAKIKLEADIGGEDHFNIDGTYIGLSDFPDFVIPNT